eukprot:Hpha_TRINITY_DN15738_c2_g5::TRINITY_DN15738_c2_g5_i1::g.39024::m.39024
MCECITDNVDWGDKGNKFYEFWKLEPCCGSPCNFLDGLICVLNFSFCGPCAWCCIYAAAMGDAPGPSNAPDALDAVQEGIPEQEGSSCTVINHCLVPCLLGFMWPCNLRYNTRRMIGKQVGGPLNGYLGDCFFECLLPCFSCCQVLRAHEKETAWWWKKVCGVKFFTSPLNIWNGGAPC